MIRIEKVINSDLAGSTIKKRNRDSLVYTAAKVLDASLVYNYQAIAN